MYIYRMTIVSIVIIILTILKQIHNIQLNSYNLDQQLIWYKKNASSFIANFVLIISSIFYYVFNFLPSFFFLIISLLIILIDNIPHKQKKKLVFTARIIRLICVSVVLFLPCIILNVIFTNHITLLLLIFATALSPFVVFIAYLILLPIENAIRKKYMNEAKEILDKNDGIYVIGITGSFGKTSVKYYLSKLLKIKYSVCFTPESYNTSMGATLTIKNDLKHINEIFVCEMGARRISDIKEICDIVTPKGAIITDVGNMHLDTFLNIDNVCRGKFELVDAVLSSERHSKVTNDNIVLLNGDNKYIRQKSNEYKNTKLKIYFYGMDEKNDFTAKNISMSSNGTTFTFSDKRDGFMEEFEVHTKLLGKHNIMNLIAAISYAKLLSVDTDEIKNEIKNITAVSHRLELRPYDKENIIIDDAYNSNPNGARVAVDVLNGFDEYTKVIITPGMVELKDMQDIENESFARYAADKVDYALVVGNTNRASLNAGFNEKMSKDNVINFDKFDEAFQFAKNNIKGKKVILFENDLSDNY